MVIHQKHSAAARTSVMQLFLLRPLDRPVDMKTVPVRVVAAVVPRGSPRVRGLADHGHGLEVPIQA